MNVTREIVKDLLPLYVAGEASADSRAAVEEWLRTDPELSRLAAELGDEGVPPPAFAAAGSQQVALAATKSLLRRRSWLLALALLFTGLPASFVFDDRTGLRFLMLRDAPLISGISLAAALGLWIGFAVVSRRLRVTGI